jgi:DNA-binding MarR family transcriptional regulator
MTDDRERRSVPTDNFPGLVRDLAHEVERRISVHVRGSNAEKLRPFDTRVGIIASRHRKTVSQIARDMNVTRQAVHSAVQRLSEAGLAELVPQPGNDRDKLVTLTDSGWSAQAIAFHSIASTETEMQNILGAKAVEQLRKQLVALTSAMKLKELD